MRRNKPNKIVNKFVHKEIYKFIDVDNNDIIELMDNLDVYIVDQNGGYASTYNNFITIPLWAVQRGHEYFSYYIAHEVSHMVQYRLFGDRGHHNKKFYEIFTLICPEEYQHYELDYKPQGASKYIKK